MLFHLNGIILNTIALLSIVIYRDQVVYDTQSVTSFLRYSYIY